VSHHSDFWPERRWAVQRFDNKPGVVVEPFTSEAARDRWVKQDPSRRRAVGKRHPAVKSLRQAWARTAQNARIF